MKNVLKYWLTVNGVGSFFYNVYMDSEFLEEKSKGKGLEEIQAGKGENYEKFLTFKDSESEKVVPM